MEVMVKNSNTNNKNIHFTVETLMDNKIIFL